MHHFIVTVIMLQHKQALSWDILSYFTLLHFTFFNRPYMQQRITPAAACVLPDDLYSIFVRIAFPHDGHIKCFDFRPNRNFAGKQHYVNNLSHYMCAFATFHNITLPCVLLKNVLLLPGNNGDRHIWWVACFALAYNFCVWGRIYRLWIFVHFGG